MTHGEVLAQKVWDRISNENMFETLDVFNTLYRYSGTEQGEQSVDYITKKLEEYGVDYTRYSYEGMFSRPLSASVTVVAPNGKTYPAIAHVYGGDADGLIGELIYDEESERSDLTHLEQDVRYGKFKDKIVVTWDASTGFTTRAAASGALAVLGVWKHDDTELIHHRGSSMVWGTGTPEKAHYFPFLPSATMSKPCGSELIETAKQGRTYVRLDFKMDNNFCCSSMPVAVIPGKSDKYVMLSAHYDSWYEGITDNACADAILLELARIFKELQGDLDRSVRIAWWSGHSDGKYSGSSWYVDNHWKDIHDNCVAHINLDICGGKNTGRILMRTTLMEGMDFSAKLVEELTGTYPDRYVPMIKGADQSFYGPGVPFTIMAQNMPLPGLDKGFKNSGGGPWWHTVDDTMDKMDPEMLYRDCKMNGKLVSLLVNAEHLPAKPVGFAKEMKKFLQPIADGTNADFNVDDVIAAIDHLLPALEKMEKEIPLHEPGTTDDIIQKVCGEMIRVAYTASSPYDFDVNGGAFTTSKLFSDLSNAIGMERDNTSPMEYLFTVTAFKRSCNRIVGQLAQVEKDLELQFLKWKA